MLIYFVNVVEDLLVTAILVGVVLSYAREAQGRLGTRCVTVGIVAGLVVSAVMAYMKQNTALVSTGDWNMFIFSASLAAAVVALLFQILKAITKREKLGVVVLVALSFIVCMRVFYKVPDVINYPFNFGITTDNLISTDFAYRIIGWLGGIVLAAIICVSVSKAYLALDRKRLGAATAAIVGLVCFVQTVSLCQIFIARRFIRKGDGLYDIMFPLTTWFSNNTVLITVAIAAIAAVLAVVVIVLSLQDKEPYDNPAQHRKNRARWRNRRRWAICAIVCLALSIVTVTVVKDYNNQGPVIVESEEVEISDGYMRIPLEQVDDGHLHRFTYETQAGIEVTPEAGQPYTTQGGVGVRVIAIKKPGANAYGVGLDACDICGTTGYYERDGQVVCSKCDVVMNINTIGFKGGCNPIVIDYEMKDGYILIPVEALAAYEKIPGSSW